VLGRGLEQAEEEVELGSEDGLDDEEEDLLDRDAGEREGDGPL